MRPRFEDLGRLRRQAKAAVQGEDLEDTIRGWWSEKHGRPPSDPRFDDQPLSVHLAELLEDLARRRVRLVEELNQGAAGTRRAEIHQMIRQIDVAFGDKTPDDKSSTSGDDAVDAVEALLDAGEELTGAEIEAMLDQRAPRGGRRGG